jgi:NAD(P)-dependent dehydrogenase (short-subunit alcohol dehydrogenase family)
MGDEFRTSSYEDSFAGKLAIVTGGASGIGRATVEGLAHYGANVAFFDVDSGASEFLLKKLKPSKGRICYYLGDVSDISAVKRGFELMIDVQNGQKPSFLVNSAGIEYNDKGSILDMDSDSLDRIVDVNLNGAINMTRVVVPKMLGNGGSIVNVSSIQAERSCLPGTSYQITKSGLVGLTNSLNVECGRKGIRTNTVSPGAIATGGMGNVRGDDEGLDDLKEMIPLGRRGHSYEVANSILFLLSDQASYVQGANLFVDGGWRNNGLPIRWGLLVENDPDPI